MNKKGVLQTAAALLLTTLLLVGCGASAKQEAPMDSMASGSFGAEEMLDEPMEEAPAPEAMEETGEIREKPAKLIYRGSLDMETTAFDDAVTALQQLVKRCGGYIEASNLHNHGSGYRSAEYTVRVPAEHYRTFFDEAGALCNVTWRSEETENVSRHYYDTAGRLETQQTKLERLQELLGKAETMEDIITIESAISETEYQIDSLTGELQYYDDLVDYSTVTVNLCEVYQLSNTEGPATSFGSRLGKGFAAGFRDFVRGGEELLVSLAYHWVTVLILLVAAVLAIRYIRRRKKNLPAGTRRPSRRFGKHDDGQEPRE